MPEDTLNPHADNPFPFSDSNKRYHTYDYAMRRRFGCKVARVSLNAGFLCPNIDGKKGRGGCTFCSPSGSGEFGGDPRMPLARQFMAVSREISKKWNTHTFIAYLQAHTNTYAPVEVLREAYTQALTCPGVVGLSIATRPDCLPHEVCKLLSEFDKRTFLTVELGLQTVHARTADAMNRCCSYQEFLEGYRRLRAYGIRIGVHLINGLPGESPDDMLETARAVAGLSPDFVKIHMLCILEGSPLAAYYRENPFPLLNLHEYAAVVCSQLELLPPQCVIGRLTGDGAPGLLLAPDWTKKKLTVLNEIDKGLVRRDSWQGKYYHPGLNLSAPMP